jgi:hypothetical protein
LLVFLTGVVGAADVNSRCQRSGSAIWVTRILVYRSGSPVIISSEYGRKPPGQTRSVDLMPVQTSNLIAVQDLDDSSRTKGLEDSDLAALRAVANWIKTFVALPNNDLGRDGPVCPGLRSTNWRHVES